MAEPMDMGTMNRVIETISTNEEEEKEEINGDVEKETQPLPDRVDVVSQKEACARYGKTRRRQTIPDLNNQCAYCDEYHRDMFDGGDCTHCYEIQGNQRGT